MTRTHVAPPGRSNMPQVARRVQLIAAVLGVLPLYWALVALQIRGGQAVSLGGFVFYLAVICPLSIAIVLFLLRVLCGESPGQLNLRAGRVSKDLLATLILSLVIVVASVASTYLLSRLMPRFATNTSVSALFRTLVGNPWLLGIFVGPLVFLGALSEEVVRAFLLGRLSKVWPSTTGKLAAIIVSAGLFGLIHLYQGPVHAIWTGVLGLIMALYYVRFGRLLPLVLAHYATNALQIAVFAARVG